MLIRDIKDQEISWQPLLLVDLYSRDGSTVLMRLCSHQLTQAQGGVVYPDPVLGPLNYGGRILETSIATLQAMSMNGIDVTPTIELVLADADKYVWQFFEGGGAWADGFKGMRVKVRLVFWQVGTINFTSDSYGIFTGVCHSASADELTLRLTADSLMNLSRTSLPQVPIQKRCPWLLPGVERGADSSLWPEEDRRNLALKEDSKHYNSWYYNCGNTDPAKRSCTYIKTGPKGCIDNGMWPVPYNANGHYRYGGVQWYPPLAWHSRPYGHATQAIEGRNLWNESRYGEYYPLLWGVGAIEPPIIDVTGDANYTRIEVAAAYGQIVDTPDATAPAITKTAAVVAGSGNGQPLWIGIGGTMAVFDGQFQFGTYFQVGDQVLVASVDGNFNLNGVHTITKIEKQYSSVDGQVTNWIKLWLGPLLRPQSVAGSTKVTYVPDPNAPSAGNGDFVPQSAGGGGIVVPAGAYAGAEPVYGPIQCFINDYQVFQSTFGADFRNFTYGFFRFVSTGGRDGQPNLDPGYVDSSGQPVGDPFGSIGVIECSIPRDKASSDSQPRVRLSPVLGTKIHKFVRVLSLGGGGGTNVRVALDLPAGAPNPVTEGTLLTLTGCTSTHSAWISVDSYGKTIDRINTTWKAVNVGANTVDLAASSSDLADSSQLPLDQGASGHMGYLGHTRNPIWLEIELLGWANWIWDDIDLDSAIAAAAVCDEQIPYKTVVGLASHHARFSASVIIRQRRTAAEIFNGLRNNCGLVASMVANRLTFSLRGTLGFQQPEPIDGSNNNSPFSSLALDGVTSLDGYLAYDFDDSNILKDDSGQSTLRVFERSLEEAPNRLAFTFQDEENEYTVDNLTEIEEDDIARSGMEVPGVYPIDGINSFDQGLRRLRTALAELHRGNPRGWAQGSWLFEWKTSFRAIHLRLGHIVGLSSIRYAANGRMFARITAIRASSDCEILTLTGQWHEDAWYCDNYKPANEPPWSNPGSRQQNRPPYDWLPYELQYPSEDPYYPGEWTFGLSQYYAIDADGWPTAGTVITGKLPVDLFAPAEITPPALPFGGMVETLKGHLKPDTWYYLSLTTKSAPGATGYKQSPLSKIVSVKTKPASTSAQGSQVALRIPQLVWPPAAAGYLLYLGYSPQALCCQAISDTLPLTLDVIDFQENTFEPPDPNFALLRARGKFLYHAGVWGAAIDDLPANLDGSHTRIKIGGAQWTPGMWAGREVSVISDIRQLEGASPAAAAPAAMLTGPPAQARIENLTRPGAVNFAVGEGWKVTIHGQPGLQVSVQAILANGSAISVVEGVTDANGDFVLRSTDPGQTPMLVTEAGLWTEVWSVGGVPASPTLGFRVYAALPAPGAPVVSLLNVSRPGMQNFLVGDIYRLEILGPANQAVSVTATVNGVARAPFAFGVTDAYGEFAVTGLMLGGSVGTWQEVWTVGGAATTPAQLSFVVSASQPLWNYPVSDNTSDTLIIDPVDGRDLLRDGVSARNACVMRALPVHVVNTAAEASIEDPLWINSLEEKYGIDGLSNSNPIVVSLKQGSSQLPDGLNVRIYAAGGGSIGNDAAIGSWTLTAIGDNAYTIPAAGSGNYTGGAMLQDVGLLPNQEKGRLLHFYKGNLAGARYQIIRNTPTKIYVDHFDQTPNAESRYIVEDAGWAFEQLSGEHKANSTAQSDPASVPISLVLGIPNTPRSLLVQVFTQDAKGRESLGGPFREIFIFGRAAQLHVIEKGTFGIAIGAPLTGPWLDAANRYMVRKEGMLTDVVGNAKHVTAGPLYIDILRSTDQGANWSSIFANGGVTDAYKLVIPATALNPDGSSRQYQQATFVTPGLMVYPGDWLRPDLLSGTGQDIEIVARWSAPVEVGH